MTLAAVALQDHMSRSLSLQDPIKKKKINYSLPAASRNKKTNKAVGKTCKKDDDKEEYVLDPKPVSLTLGMFCCIIIQVLYLYMYELTCRTKLNTAVEHKEINTDTKVEGKEAKVSV